MTPVVQEVRIAWTAGRGLISRLIQSNDFAVWNGKRIPSAINHVLLHFVFRGGLQLIYESRGGKGIIASPFEHLETALKDGRVARLIEYVLPLDFDGLGLVWKRAVSLHGRGYDNGLLLLYLLWGRIFGKASGEWLFQWNDPSKFTCNEFTIAAIRGLVPQVPCEADQSFTPEGLFRTFFGIPSAIYCDDFADWIDPIHDHAIQVGAPSGPRDARPRPV